jgi:hypothetical protein
MFSIVTNTVRFQVNTLRNAIATSDAQFKVRVLLDYLRGTRGGGSTGMLQDLVNEHTDDGKMQVRSTYASFIFYITVETG